MEHLSVAADRGLPRDEMRELLLRAGWPGKFVKPYLDRTFRKVDKGAVLKVYGVAKKFNSNQVLDQVDIEVRRGEIFGLIGVSGAGKTTLLNIIVGFLKPDRGDVLLSLPDRTESVIKNAELIKSHVGFSTQTPSFYRKLSVRENIEHFARLYHLSDRDAVRRARALIDLVGLKDAEHVIASNLSGGMQKRLDIACALIHDPDILILDEPTADLDPVMRKQLWGLIKEINAKGTTVLLASHFLAEIELLCSRIAILHDRRVAVVGSADQLREVYAKNYEVFLQTASKRYDSFRKAVQRSSIRSRVEDGELVINTPVPKKTIAAIADKLGKGDLQRLHVSRPSLGRVFESVVKK